eukprot:Pompholyxophrys_punicea_v1_NODE_18_length_5920_cov_44.741176.p5 type:complete len:129 gc:universal NODE_18_length_5920_cov_44.741176:5452-5838(+)
MRHIAHTPRLAHTAPLFFKLQVLSIFSLHNYKICLLAHKLLHSSTLLLQLGLPPLTLASVSHNHNTRFSSLGLLHQPSPTRHFSDLSLHHRLVHAWNALPLDLRKIDNIIAFKKALKTHILQQAFEAR